MSDNINIPGMHVSGKRSSLHLTFQNDKKTEDPSNNKVDFTKCLPSSKLGNDSIASCYDIDKCTVSTPLSLNRSSKSQQKPLLQSPINTPDMVPPSPPPQLPPKLKVKSDESFQLVETGSGYAKPKLPIPCKEKHSSKRESPKLSVKFNKEALKYKEFNKDVLKHSKDFNKDSLKHAKDFNKESLKHSKDFNKESLKHAKDLNKESLKHSKDSLKYGKESFSLNFSSSGPSPSRWVKSNTILQLSDDILCKGEQAIVDIDALFRDPSCRDQKKKQLILHLPPSGAIHHSHHHHRHNLHEGRSHRRERLSRGFCHNIQLSGKLNISPELQVDFVADDLKDLGEIGRGGFGTVNKMVHRKTNTIMAVKRIRLTVDENEQKQLRDLEVAMWSNDCPFIVQFYGATLKEGDCWICMELMDTSLDKFYKFVYEKLNECIPESILGKVTIATLTALNYLKEKLKLIHRDVKPSNILLDRRGNIKLCDFGISGHLVDSIAKTRDAGCRPYMAPERIDPAQAKGYDVRSDVWSLGITLMELATGCFPYPKWNSVFEQLTQVVQGEPPRLNHTENGNIFTEEFVNFVNTCLTKEESSRPKYKQLLDHIFVIRSKENSVNVAQYVCAILDQMENNGKLMYTYNSYNY